MPAPNVHNMLLFHTAVCYLNSAVCDSSVDPAPQQPSSFQACCDVTGGVAFQEILGITSCVPCAPSSK